MPQIIPECFLCLGKRSISALSQEKPHITNPFCDGCFYVSTWQIWSIRQNRKCLPQYMRVSSSQCPTSANANSTRVRGKSCSLHRLGKWPCWPLDSNWSMGFALIWALTTFYPGPLSFPSCYVGTSLPPQSSESSPCNRSLDACCLYSLKNACWSTY